MASDVVVSVVESVAIIEIRRPPANYFDHELLRDIADRCEELQAGGICHAIVLCSQGKHFCAGAGFGSHELRTNRDEAGARLYQEGIRLFKIELLMIAAVQGAAVGGGLGLACAADLRVGSAASRFHANFASLGFHHGFGLSVSLPQIVGPQKAKDLLLTSRSIRGDQAHALGLVDRLVEAGQERAGAVALANEIATLATLSVRSIKQTLNHSYAQLLPLALARELQEQRRLWRTPDSERRVSADLAARQLRLSRESTPEPSGRSQSASHKEQSE